MHYKTLTLDLLHSHKSLYRRLRQSRTLLETLDAIALDLKASHLAWVDRLAEDRPQDDPQSRKAQALELALAELAERLVREDSPPASADAR